MCTCTCMAAAILLPPLQYGVSKAPPSQFIPFLFRKGRHHNPALNRQGKTGSRQLKTDEKFLPAVEEILYMPHWQIASHNGRMIFNSEIHMLQSEKWFVTVFLSSFPESTLERGWPRHQPALSEPETEEKCLRSGHDLLKKVLLLWQERPCFPSLSLRYDLFSGEMYLPFSPSPLFPYFFLDHLFSDPL